MGKDLWAHGLAIIDWKNPFVIILKYTNYANLARRIWESDDDYYNLAYLGCFQVPGKKEINKEKKEREKVFV